MSNENKRGRRRRGRGWVYSPALSFIAPFQQMSSINLYLATGIRPGCCYQHAGGDRRADIKHTHVLCAIVCVVCFLCPLYVYRYSPGFPSSSRRLGSCKADWQAGGGVLKHERDSSFSLVWSYTLCCSHQRKFKLNIVDRKTCMTWQQQDGHVEEVVMMKTIITYIMQYCW